MHIPDPKSFTPAPSGAHRAICVGFIDLGTQKTEYQGQTSYKRLVQIRWELCDEAMSDGRPFTIGKRYTWSMSDRASLRKDLESWRGRPFEKADFGPSGFDTKKLMGAPCLLTVGHTDKNGTTYANINAVSPLPKGMEKPTKPVNEPTYLALEGEFDRVTFEKLSDKMREFIAQSDEYQQLVNGVAQRDIAEQRGGNGDLDDEIPF